MSEALYNSSGILKYSNNGGYSLVLEADKELARYYRSFIPKSHYINTPKYSPHITIVRFGKEVPTNLESWGKYDNEEIEFCYSNIIGIGTIYYWLNCFSKRLEEIRAELGLPVDSLFTKPPEGFIKCFHMTIANDKEKLNQVQRPDKP